MLSRMGASDRDVPLVWLDLEMTGLDPDECHVLEIATIVTDVNLEITAVGPNIVIHQPDSVLEQMNPWCIEQHGASGLTEKVKHSTVSLRDAERETLAFLRQHTEPKRSPLCGNSIGLDQRFIEKHMPALDEFLHDQLIDVTSVKELVGWWHPDAKPPAKADTHRALDDVHESIKELLFYREHVFVEKAAP